MWNKTNNGTFLLSALLIFALLLNVALSKVSYFDVYKTRVFAKHTALQTNVGDVKYRNYRWLSLVSESSSENHTGIVKVSIKVLDIPCFSVISNFLFFKDALKLKIFIANNIAISQTKSLEKLCVLLI